MNTRLFNKSTSSVSTSGFYIILSSSVAVILYSILNDGIFSISTWFPLLPLLLILIFLYTSWHKERQCEVLELSRAKRVFLSGMSHELRNPLNSILGFSEALSHGYLGKLNKKQAEHIAYINASGNQLLELVDNLLDISEIEGGQIEFDPKPVDLQDLIDISIQSICTQAEAKNINVKCKTNEKLADLWVFVDQAKFEKILSNLLSNAIKFSPAHGLVEIDTKLKDGKISINVHDTGPGIPAKYKSLIFERFFQINQGSDNKDPGVGLGLPISLHLAKLHGGRIVLKDSDMQPGSCFSIEIPLLVEKTKTLENSTLIK